MIEHDLQNLIRLELSKRGFCVFRANVGKVKMHDGRFFKTGLPAGFPDLFAVKGNKIYLLEVKQKKGRLRESQKRFKTIMETRYNTIVYKCKSVEDALKAVGGDDDERRTNNIK